MKTVEVHLMGRAYQIACEPSGEEHVQELSRMVEEKMKLAASVGQGAIGEIRLFLLAALMLADEVVEARNGSESATAQLRRQNLMDEDLMVSAVDHLAGRINALAARIEST
jgi:cell division protein ZapA